jgi:O-antigen/teichoic acid export membrane protein
MNAPGPFARRIVGEASWVTAGQAASIVGRLAALKILTTLLAPDVFGEVTLLLATSAFASNIFFQPVGQAALRFYPDAIRDGRFDALRRLTGRTLVAGGTLALVLMAVGAIIWLGVMGRPGSAPAFAAMGALLAADAWRAYESNFLNAARDQRTYAIWNVVDAWARALFAFAAVRLAGPTAASVLVGQVAACVLVALAFRPRFARPSGPRADSREVHSWIEGVRPQYVRFVAPLVPFALFGWVIGLSDRFFLAAMAGAGAVGLYGAVYALGSQPFIAIASVGVLTFRPVLYEALARDDRRTERRVIRTWLALATLVAVAGALVCWALAPWIVRIATGPAFWAGASLLPWIAAAYGLQGAQFVFESLIFARRRTSLLLALQAIGAVASIALYVVLIPRIGALGAAIGTFGSIATTFVASAVLARVSRRT